MPNSPNLKLALLIDDDEVTNYLNVLLFKKAAIFERVVNFESAYDALNFLGDCLQGPIQFPELIMVDINMPGLSGWQFLEEYLKLDVEVQKYTKVAMASIQFCKEDLEFAHHYRNSVVLQQKPFSTSIIQNLAEGCSFTK